MSGNDPNTPNISPPCQYNTEDDRGAGDRPGDSPKISDVERTVVETLDVHAKVPSDKT